MSLTLTDRLAAAADAVLEPLDVDRYYRLMETGVIPEGAPIELIDGLLVRKDRRDHVGDIMAVGTRHASTIRKLIALLKDHERLLPIVVQSQQPIHLDPHDEPEPDVSVLAGSLDDFDARHPQSDDVELVIEVADSSLGFDLGRKLDLYRDAGIREYWVVNLRDDVIEVFRRPDKGTWGEQRRYGRGEALETRLADSPVQIPVDAVLGRPA